MRFVFFVFAIVAFSQGAAAFQSCLLEERLGTAVFVETDAGQDDAKVGTPLTVGMTVRTGPDSAAVILCEDIQVALGNDTVFVVEPEDTRPRGSLVQGILGLIGLQLDGNHSIKTSRLVAAVRSTEWIVSVGDNADAVFVREGRVDVSADGRESSALSAGDGVDVRDNAPLNARPWDQARIEEIAARLPIGWR